MRYVSFIIAAALAAFIAVVSQPHAQTTQPMPANHPPIVPQLPAGHPPIDQEAPALSQSPKANIHDVGSIQAIVAAYYASISGPAGQARDWNRFRSLFMPQAQFVTVRPNSQAASIVVLTPEDFILANNTYFEKGGYFESESSRSEKAFGNIAHVFSVYESRRSREDAKPYSRGINSMQLLFDGERWYIASIMWDHEREDNPLPAN